MVTITNTKPRMRPEIRDKYIAERMDSLINKPNLFCAAAMIDPCFTVNYGLSALSGLRQITSRAPEKGGCRIASIDLVSKNDITLHVAHTESDNRNIKDWMVCFNSNNRTILDFEFCDTGDLSGEELHLIAKYIPAQAEKEEALAEQEEESEPADLSNWVSVKNPPISGKNVHIAVKTKHGIIVPLDTFMRAMQSDGTYAWFAHFGTEKYMDENVLCWTPLPKAPASKGAQ